MNRDGARVRAANSVGCPAAGGGGPEWTIPEPVTLCSTKGHWRGVLGGRPPRMKQWAHLDLNQGPLPYQGSALTELSYGPVDRTWAVTERL